MKGSYLSRLEGIYNKKSFQRKVDYIRYNFGPIIRNLKTRKNISVLEVGPGKGEFIKYLHTCGIKDIDIRVKDITHDISKEDWTTTVNVAEDGAEQTQ